MEENTLISFNHTREALNRCGQLVEATYKEKMLEPRQHQDWIKPYNAVFTGRLLNSVHYLVNVDDSQFDVCLQLEDYWRDLEEGGKTLPDANEMFKWAIVKRLLPTDGSAYLGKNMDDYLPWEGRDVVGFWKFTGHAMAGKTQVGRHFLEETLNELNAEIDQIIEEGVTLDLQESFSGILDLLASHFD